MMVINASTRYIQSKIGQGHWRTNATVLMDGTVVAVWLPWTSNYGPSLMSNTGGRAGPVDFVAMSPANFSTAFGTQSEYVLGSTRYARNAWVANASVVFTPFHVHTWYSVKDNLSYAQVKIYEMNITTGGASLIRAFVTKGDGSGYGLYDPRTTNEMYPVYGTRYKTNELVPIPLEAIHLGLKRPYRNNFYPSVNLRAHLNVTVRVWWETVLVNTTFFANRDTDGFSTLDNSHLVTATPPALRDGIPTGGFYSGVVSQLLQAFNLNYNYTTQPYVSGGHSIPLAIFLNSTVFYWRCGVRDDDLMVGGFDLSMGFVGSALFDAQCMVNLRDSSGATYHTLHERGSTGEPHTGPDGEQYALSDDPHDWPGYLPAFRAYLRAPNATMWMYLVGKFGNIKVFQEGRFARDETYTSRYYSGTADLTANDPSKVAVNDYLKTRSISDDPGPYRGIRLEVLYASGYKNLYGGSKQSVGVYVLENPYLIALKDLVAPLDTWPDPWSVPDPDPATIEHELYPDAIDWFGDGYRGSGLLEVKLGTSESGAPIIGIVDSNTVDLTDAASPIFGARNFESDGKLLVVANVSDIVFAVYDNQGSILTPPQTQVWLTSGFHTSPVLLAWYRFEFALGGQAFYIRESEFVPFLYYVVINVDLFPDPDNPPSHIAVAYQMPEEKTYGITVKFDGVTVYQNPGEINKLIETKFVPITARVFKVKLILVDCQERPLTDTFFWIFDPATNSQLERQTGPDGATDIILAGDSLKLIKVYWKGVDVPFLEAIMPNGDRVPASPDGSITIPVTTDVYAPIKVKALITDFVFKTFDFQGTIAIPRLNVTVSWVGYNISDPARKPWYFLETMDPWPYAIRDGSLAERLGVVPAGQGNIFDFQRWNTSVRVAQFFSYVIQHKNATNEYIFYQMPPAIYNITVTTVAPRTLGGYNYRDASPGYGFWPGESGNRTYESYIHWMPGSESMLPQEVHEKADTRVVLREFNRDLRFTVCDRLEVNLNTWALHWFLDMIDGDLRIGDVRFDIINDNFVSMTLGLGNFSKWTGSLEYKTILYGDNTRPGPQDYSYLWWNGSYRLQDVRLTTNMSFVVDKFYNKSALPNKVWPALNFTLQPNADLHKQQTFYSKWVKLQDAFGYKIIIYDKDTLRAPLPVAFIKPRAIDKGGAPLENALIEAWIVNLNVTSRIDISAMSGGPVNRTITTVKSDKRTTNTTYTFWWEWETKRVADPDSPQRFKEIKWDRINITFRCVRSVGSNCHDSATHQIFVQVPPWPAKLILRDVFGLNMTVTERYIYLMPSSDFAFDANNATGVPGTSTDPLSYRYGQLKYARWYTKSDGTIKSFTVSGYEGLLLLPTSGFLNETYGIESGIGHNVGILPTGGVDRTHAISLANTKEEFHYQFNVVWKSAVVYSENYVLDKGPVKEFGASEVYDVTFMFTLSNSTDPAHAVHNLNLWIYYPNVTTWWDQSLWSSWPPAPQDYEACEDSAFPCEKRVTLISSTDADGIVDFSKIPGPRFMNTTWKYVFSANHSDVTWLNDLVATQFVLNNETFGDGPLKTVTTSRVTVPIMLNAARQLSVVLLTWRDEQGVPTAYPVQGYTVRLQARKLGTSVDTGVLSGVSDAYGFVTFDSDPTNVRKIFWAGLTVRYRVEPPAYVNEPDDAKWKTWMQGLNVQLVEQTYNTPTRRSSFAYFPDEEPTHWAITTISTWFDPDGFCVGLCTYYDKDQARTISKPFVITVNYAAVTVRAIDFNGRPLAGAFVELVDRASGRIAGWSYTANNSWTARPIDLQTLYMYHRGKLLDPRPIGGAGYTAIMNLTFGTWNYDANNDDTVDNSGVRNPLNMIIRVYWLATDPNPNNANGNLWPIWPFRDETAPLPRHVKVYDSDFDETDAAAKTLEVPHSEAAIGLKLPDRVVSASDPVSRGVHRDVTTAVFDFKALLNYGGKTLPPDILRRFEVFVYKKTGATTELSLRFTEGVGMSRGTFTINRLPRGVYELEVRFGDAGTIFKRTFDISTVNVGTVQVEASMPFTDLSFEVTDLRGRPLSIAPGDVSITPEAYYFRREVAGNVITITALYTGAPVTFSVKYTSPTYGTSVQVTLTDTADGIRTRLLGGRTLQMPVDDVVINAVDAQGRPVGGAVVTFGRAQPKTTGPDGKAVFERVPLGTEDSPITYTVRVSVEGVEVYARDEPISVARKEISVLAQLFALTVRVVGELGQGLQGASVQLLRAGTTVGTASADAAGSARFEKLAPASYEVRATYKGFTGSASVTLDQLRRGDVVEIRLPVYVEVLGIPMSLATLLALAIGIILLVIVLAIIISEYRWWRGRRLGVYAPPPPKTPAK
ncbi:MAG: carboxypeptidase-like regulatory domain-containing protein [Nitrososphaerota archaeon]